MTNAEKYRTAEERKKAYFDYCLECIENGFKYTKDEFDWLDLEVQEELKHCPFCGGMARIIDHTTTSIGYYFVECKTCFGKTVSFLKPDEAIAAWNRRV